MQVRARLAAREQHLARPDRSLQVVGRLGCLGLLGLTVVGSVLVILNRDRVSAALDSSAERARATLFRLGEVMSISTAGWPPISIHGSTR